MLAQERYSIILQSANTEGIIKVSELKEQLNVSQETIRRDLNYLEQCGKVQKIFGGAKLLSNSSLTNPTSDIPYTGFNERKKENAAEKNLIAKCAASLISEGQSVAMDSGTTVVSLAHILKKQFKQLTVVTNSLNVVDALSNATDFTTILTGGIYRADDRVLVSDISSHIFDQLSINICFLTALGVSLEKGVTYQRVDEVYIQRRMMQCSEQTILLVDSSKLGKNSLIRMCKLQDITAIITDRGVSPDIVKEFENVGVKIIIAE